ncbi:MAG: hypothetical protein JO016_06480 [Actinobacteria bacterium]|nr:hypothetical protein [Actinomycetota bacterium]
MTARRFPYRLAAWSLVGLTLAVIAGAIVLAVTIGNSALSSGGAVLAIIVSFLAVGLVVALRQPRNPVGWVLMGTALPTALIIAGPQYAQFALTWAHGAAPGGRLLLFLGNAFWPAGLLIGMTTLLLFPDGRLSRAARRGLVAYVAVAVLIIVSQALPAWYVATLPHLHWGQGGQITAPRPVGYISLLSTGLPVLAIVPFWLAWIVRVVIRFRRSTGDARQQYKWFTAGAAITIAGLIVMTTVEAKSTLTGLLAAVNVLATLLVVALPLAMGFGILRYRLYDIDRIISRTVAYALVTGLLVGVYAGLVLLATEVLQFSSPIAVAASTLIAAALFNPLRRRVQHGVDRRFNRARYDADLVVAAFAARLTGAVDLDAVHGQLTTVVSDALEPAQLQVWIPGSDQ